MGSARSSEDSLLLNDAGEAPFRAQEGDSENRGAQRPPVTQLEWLLDKRKRGISPSTLPRTLNQGHRQGWKFKVNEVVQRKIVIMIEEKILALPPLNKYHMTHKFCHLL